VRIWSLFFLLGLEFQRICTTRGPYQADFFPKQMPSMHKFIFFPYIPGDGRVEHKSD
jgi:hypothetical protein